MLWCNTLFTCILKLFGLTTGSQSKLSFVTKKKKEKKEKGIWIIIFSLNLWTGEIPWKHINADCEHDYD